MCNSVVFFHKYVWLELLQAQIMKCLNCCSLWRSKSMPTVITHFNILPDLLLLYVLVYMFLFAFCWFPYVINVDEERESCTAESVQLSGNLWGEVCPPSRSGALDVLYWSGRLHKNATQNWISLYLSTKRNKRIPNTVFQH